MKQVGKITHYYDRLGVAIIELVGTLKVGDSIKIKKGEREIEQKVDSLQIERPQVRLVQQCPRQCCHRYHRYRRYSCPLRPGAACRICDTQD